MLKIGITGGIGSGKTTVCRIFEKLGINVYYADIRAKWLMENDKTIISRLKKAFGSETFDDTGKLNRAMLAQKVFADANKVAQLNNIVHPAVFTDYETWVKSHETEHYTLKEAALLIESNSYKQLDQLVVVVAPEQVRIDRVMKRDGTSEAKVKSRISHQSTDEEKIKLADHVIFNDNKRLLIPQVIALHKYFISNRHERI